jgi:hypothetical protein
MYGASAQPACGDNKIQQQPYGEKTQETQPMYYDQARTMAPEPAPPTYMEQHPMRGEKQEYTPVASGGLATKEV